MRLVPIVLLAAVVAGCNRGDNKKTPPATRPKPVAQQVQRAIYPEEDVVAIMRALDTAEIVTSRVAREVSQNDEVLRYASVMIKDHADIMRLVDQTGVVPRENAISGKIKRSADSIAHGLSGVTMGFNNTYIEEQVKSHRNALQTLDSVIIPSAKKPELRSLLEKLRPAIVAHLQRAMQILAVRRKETADRGEQWVSGLPAPGDTTHAAERPRLLGEPVSGAATQTEPKPAQPKPKPKPTPVQPRFVPAPDTDTIPLTTTSNM